MRSTVVVVRRHPPQRFRSAIKNDEFRDGRRIVERQDLSFERSSSQRNPSVIQGAGSTFAEPMFEAWVREYSASPGGGRVEYKVVGSGDGQEMFWNEAVDFVATDELPSDEKRRAVKRGVIAVPITTGSIAVAYNPDVAPDGLRLSRGVMVDIFLGKITHWNDERIAKLNPGVGLRKLDINRAVRVDGSGTTLAFSSHLSAISAEWRNGPGTSKLVSWPGQFQRERGNDRVAAMIQRVEGGVGYVESSTARIACLHVAAISKIRAASL